MLNLIIGILVSCVLLWFGIGQGGNALTVSALIDLPSIAFICGIALLSLSISGLIKYFPKVFSLGFKKGLIDEATSHQVVLAAKCAEKANILGGVFYTLISLDSLRAFEGQFDGLEAISHLHISLLPIITAIFFNLILNIFIMRIEAHNENNNS